MPLLHPLPPSASSIPSPRQFTFPFRYTPHPLCQLAAKEVMDYCYSSKEMYPKEGKMFGVLVVEHEGQRYYLRAFSGIYNGSYHHEGFVPTIYDLQNPDGYFYEEEKRIDAISQQIKAIDEEFANNSDGIPPLKGEIKKELLILRKEKSNALQMWTFRQFRMLNAYMEEKDLTEIFKDFKSPFSVEEYLDYKEGRTQQKPKSKVGIPPGGAGECCAPKLLQYAYQHKLKPLCMAEFWIGPSPKDEMRSEGNYYPACQHKCRPILGHMLVGLNVEADPMLIRSQQMLSHIKIVHEDDNLLVVYKPSGLPSVPTKDEDQPSLLSHFRQSYPECMVPHRLDMDTSGLMIVAKTPVVYKILQAQFYRHEIKKTYVAILDKIGINKIDTDNIDADIIDTQSAHKENVTFTNCTLLPEGTISLPLAPNPLDRPRQMVSFERGKTAVTHYRFLRNDKVELIPETGRTHQLRVHCAHPEGLNCPIKGDSLYGKEADRLYLHAQSIEFAHPITGEFLTFSMEEI